MKTYAIYYAGSTLFGMINATCISKAAKSFIATLEKPASYSLTSKEGASVSYKDNYTIMSDFVIIQKTSRTS